MVRSNLKEAYKTNSNGEVILSDADIDSEIVAMFSENRIFTDKNTVDDIARLNLGVAEKIYNWVKEKVYSFIPGSREKAMMLKAERLYRNAIAEAKIIVNNNLSNDLEKSNVLDDDGKLIALTEEEALEAAKKVVAMEPVVTISENEFSRSANDSRNLVEKITDFFKKYNNVLYRKDIGTINLNKKGAKSLLAHLPQYVDKFKAVEALPSVIDNGEIIRVSKNWKNRKKDTLIICAPINISNQVKYMAVVIERNTMDNINNYYLHDLIVLNKKSKPKSHKTLHNTEIENLIYYTNNILEKAKDVNNNANLKQSNKTIYSMELDLNKLDTSKPLKDIVAGYNSLNRSTGEQLKSLAPGEYRDGKLINDYLDLATREIIKDNKISEKTKEDIIDTIARNNTSRINDSYDYDTLVNYIGKKV